MRITRLEASDGKRIIIHMEENEPVTLHIHLLTDALLYEGKEFTAEELDTWIRMSRFHEALSAIGPFVGYQPRTTGEVVKRLIRDGYDDETARSVADHLEEHGMLDDRAYAMEYAAQQLTRYGVMRIRHKLKEKGISSEILDRLGMEDDASAALQLTRKKYGSRAEHPDYAMKGKISAYLSGRGFTFDTVQRVVNQLEESI